ncbi:MAG: MMPL family transporter, partial [Pedobacter sp.]
YTGGNASVSYDLIEKLYKKFPLMIICVYLLTAIILYVSYRSVLIPLKAILVNTLSVLSCYGILILIFQYGYFNFLINLKYSPESIISGLPVILFCIMFSLSMDYEVFLLSSMSEEYKVSKDNHKAVISGLINTSGIITKAAVIMLIVFSAFIQADIILIKMLGVGLALAVFIDATIIRLILVPSLMNLAGKYNWLSFKDFFRLFKQVP